MLKVLILTAFLAVGLAAPAQQNTEALGLTRPSPINPDVLSDPKPEDGLVVSDVEVKDYVKPETPDENRRKRDEHENETEKPQDVKQQHGSDKLDLHDIGHDAIGCLEDKCTRKSAISKRDTVKHSEHEHEHKPKEAAEKQQEHHEKPHSGVSQEGLHNPARKELPIPDRTKHIKPLEHHSSEHEGESSKKHKRDHHEHEEHHEKPHSAAAKDDKPLEHHLAQHEAESSKKHKRDLHEQQEHLEKQHSVAAHEDLHHNPARKELPISDHTKDDKPLEHHLAQHEAESSKKHKRDHNEEHHGNPHSVEAQEDLHHNPAIKELPISDHSKDYKQLEHHLAQHEVELSKKHKRDLHEQQEHLEKPHSVVAQEGLVHKPSSTDLPNPDYIKAIKTLEERLADNKGEPPKKQKRDIPVPSVAKFEHSEESSKQGDKKEPKLVKPLEEKDKPQVEDVDIPHQHEHKSPSTEHPVIRHKPVPVAELFARPKPHEEEAGAAEPISAPAEKA